MNLSPKLTRLKKIYFGLDGYLKRKQKQLTGRVSNWRPRQSSRQLAPLPRSIGRSVVRLNRQLLKYDQKAFGQKQVYLPFRRTVVWRYRWLGFCRRALFGSGQLLLRLVNFKEKL